MTDPLHLEGSPVAPARLRRLDDGERTVDPDGGHVLYWMQRSVRAEHNDALEHALTLANHLDLPLHVVFGLTGEYPEATARHLRFHVEGLADVARRLEERGVAFAVRHGHPPQVAAAAADGAAAVVTDRAYLRHLVAWREDLVAAVTVPVVQVEGDVVVPVDLASDKREYAARTIRKKLNRHRDEFLVELPAVDVARTGAPLDGLDLTDVDEVLATIGAPDDEDGPARFRGGLTAAREHLATFLQQGTEAYRDGSPDPLGPGVSHQSPYLHFGHVSPVEVGCTVRGGSDDAEFVEGYLEQLVVRRELAVNYVRFEPAYDEYASLPDWARTTLDEHRDDDREHVYTREELAAGATHDAAWNACQAQVREDGYLHNHLRMYWGKQVLLWSETPEAAFENLLAINNRYLLDGRDCASYASVAWIFGLHDRAWQETDVAGKTRPMTRSGLDRKLTKSGLRAWLDHVEDEHGALDGD